MIEINKAMEIAKNFIISFSGEKTGLHLEEAYLSNDKNIWRVTYSFFETNHPLNHLQKAAHITGRRAYRTIEIDNKNEEVVGMKAGFATSVSENA